MGYSENDSMVRVDFFKPSGKWYLTEAVFWSGKYKGSEQLIHDSFAQSLRDHFKDNPGRLSDMTAICLYPCHENAHPLMIKDGEWNRM